VMRFNVENIPDIKPHHLTTLTGMFSRLNLITGQH
jgi:tellurite resistance-related uncharacterized protein